MVNGTIFYNIQVMLYELCNYTQAFLHQHNHPPVQSFYEEMMKNKQRQHDREREKHEEEQHHKKQLEEKLVNHLKNLKMV